MSSCKKDEISSEIEKPVEKPNYVQELPLNVKSTSPSLLANSITVENGLLVFENYEHLELVVEGLINLQENHLSSFNEAYPDLNNEQLDLKEEEIGFETYAPLIEFETLLNFNSRRAHIESNIIQWLDQLEINLEDNPNRADTFSPEFRTIMNLNGKVKIGTEIVDLLETRSSNSCWFYNKKYYDQNVNNNNNKFEVFLEHDSWPWLLKVHGEVTYFKRKNNGRWKRSRAELSINVAGRANDEECRFKFPYFKKDRKKRKSLDVRVHYWGPPNWMKGEDNRVTSNYIVNGLSGFIVLN